jgi:hypothetical protein
MRPPCCSRQADRTAQCTTFGFFTWSIASGAADVACGWSFSAFFNEGGTLKGRIMRRTTGAICAFAVFVLQAALQSSYAKTAEATFDWLNRTRSPMRSIFKSANGCLVSSGPDAITLNPGERYSLQVTYVLDCSSLQVTWIIGGDGQDIHQQFVGDLTYNIATPTRTSSTKASVGIKILGMALTTASFRITCGAEEVNCYRPNKTTTSAVVTGPGAFITLLSNGWYGRQLAGGMASR